jgi:predicted nucleic acid-binding protein
VGTLIDTSVIVAAERGDLVFDEILSERGTDQVAIAAITASELLQGVDRFKGERRERIEQLVGRLLATVPIVPFDLAIARVHAGLAADLAAKGLAVGAHDLIVGATAISLGYDLMTRSGRSYARIPGISLVRL